MQAPNKKWEEVKRTETIKATLNPDFAKSFVLNFYFEETQAAKIKVWDQRKKFQ